MANPEHLAILKEGVETWNAWRRENEGVQVDLSKANLDGADLIGANLTKANLTGAHLYGADLTGAKLSKASLTRANLTGAKLNGANLFRAVLERADLPEANLNLANLYGANLYGANLAGLNLGGLFLTGAILTMANLTEANVEKARLGETVFADTDLTGTKGLDQCEHGGPSTLDHRTLAKNPHLPLAFLRGCGLSDWQIESAKLLSPNLTPSQVTDIGYKIIEFRSDPAIQFHSCFISYSSNDDTFARHLHDGLQETGVRCWFAPEDLKIGERIRHAIHDAIRLHDKLLLILSGDSVHSQWVEDEVERALEKERKDKSTVLFPIRLDDSVMEIDRGWPVTLRNSRHIGDFTHWKDHDQYNTAFQRLLHDLKA